MGASFLEWAENINVWHKYGHNTLCPHACIKSLHFTCYHKKSQSDNPLHEVHIMIYCVKMLTSGPKLKTEHLSWFKIVYTQGPRCCSRGETGYPHTLFSNPSPHLRPSCQHLYSNLTQVVLWQWDDVCWRWVHYDQKWLSKVAKQCSNRCQIRKQSAGTQGPWCCSWCETGQQYTLISIPSPHLWLRSTPGVWSDLSTHPLGWQAVKLMHFVCIRHVLCVRQCSVAVFVVIIGCSCAVIFVGCLCKMYLWMCLLKSLWNY